MTKDIIDMGEYTPEDSIMLYNVLDPDTVVLKTNNQAEFNYFRLQVAKLKSNQFYYLTANGDKVNITPEGEVDGEYPFSQADTFEYDILTLSFDYDVKVQNESNLDEFIDEDVKPEEV